MPSIDTSKTYWRSLNHLADSPELREIVENEFPSRVDQLVDPLSRRRFVKLMGASLALAGLTGCDFIRWPKENILPFAQRPEGRQPGTPVFYATAMELGGIGSGLLVKSYDGRPIKVEGNPEHPTNRGATDAYCQASVLSLYDPDRSKDVALKGSPEASTWDAFVAAAAPSFKDLRENKGNKLAILAEASSSPALAALRAELETVCPQAKWYEHEALSRRNELAGAALVLGKAYRTHLDLSQAEVVVSLDADLLGAHPNALRHARDFAEGRRPVGDSRSMSRLYVVEGTFSITGGMADERLALRPSQIEGFALALAAEVVARPDVTAPEALAAALAPHAPKATDPNKALIARMAADFATKRSLIAVGERQPPQVHALAHALNDLRANIGATVTYTEEPEHGLELADLVTELNANEKVDTLLILGGNPVLTAPADLKFEAALARVPMSIHLGLYNDETGSKCTWHVPRAHYLEAWGDTRAYDGTISLTQPLIQPFYGGKTPLEMLALVLGRDPKDAKASHPYNLVRAAHNVSGVARQGFWRKALHDGVVEASAFAAVTPGRDLKDLIAKIGAPVAATTDTEVVFTQDAKIYDGRFANNGWLQELPDPLTKLTWDNAALISPDMAATLGDVIEGDVLSIDVGGAKLEVAAYVLPGTPENTVSLSLGYGRTAAGIVAAGSGKNAYVLRSSTTGMGFATAKVTKTGATYPLATTQDHHIMDIAMLNEEKERRSGELVREATREQYRKDPAFAKDVWEGGSIGMGPNPATTQLWKEPQNFDGHRWAMSIDLNTCTGCSACVVACVAENNIPVVGKSEIARGREMHWLRIDRYFSQRPLGILGKHRTPDEVKGPVRVVHQPMPCQQCENAPCESVCPVAATTHSDEGLNDMAYNRCVGTRYCANNCPYKVRHFNFFWNHHGPFHPRSKPGHAELPKLPKSLVTEATGLPAAAALEKTEQMVFNPDVTVRARGVMEKCTYCVQRIKAVTIPHRNEVHKELASLRTKLSRVGADSPEAEGLRREIVKVNSVPDGSIKTACQQACPTQAIVFGDLSDPDSQVSALHAQDRCYGLLEGLNSRPRTKYQAKLRNPSTEA